MKRNYTSGPWKVENIPSQGLTVCWGDRNPICPMRWTDGMNTKVEARVAADARLIAAAPDLLEALEPFASFACDPPCGCYNCRAKDAINKAVAE